MASKGIIPIYFESPMGSGHASVSTKLAIELMEQGYEVMFITSSSKKLDNFMHMLEPYQQKGLFQLKKIEPDIDPDHPGHFKHIEHTPEAVADAQNYRHALIRGILEKRGLENIAGLVWEMVPLEAYERSGLHHEFRALSTYLKHHDIPQYLLARDIILQSNNTSTLDDAITYEGEPPPGAYGTYREVARDIAKNLRQILVRGDTEIIPLQNSSLVASALEPMITHMGYFQALKDKPEPQDAGKNEIVVTVGGQWTKPEEIQVYTAAIEAWDAINGPDGAGFFDDPETHNRFIQNGPLRLIVPANAPDSAYEDIERQAKDTLGEVVVCRQMGVGEFGYLLTYETALLVARSGSVLGEAHAAKVPTITIPRENGTIDEEQTLRAERFASTGYCRIVKEQQLSEPVYLAKMMAESFEARFTSLVEDEKALANDAKAPHGAQKMAGYITNDIEELKAISGGIAAYNYYVQESNASSDVWRQRAS